MVEVLLQQQVYFVAEYHMESSDRGQPNILVPLTLLGPGGVPDIIVSLVITQAYQ